LLYDLGNGTPENPESAFAWYKLAAEAGIPAAQFNVGAMYDSGRGVVRDVSTSALWYARAAAQGHHRAQFSLGLLYQQGDGVPLNVDVAMAWFKLAADGGLTAAGERLKGLKSASQPKGRPSLMAATPVWPDADATLATAHDAPTATLVWVAPSAPEPVRFEVQVRTLDAANLKIVYTASLAETATVVRLPHDDAVYAWKVDAVGVSGARVSGEWRWFSVGAGARSAQSMAAPSGVSRLER
jgi:Sel1 repeat